MPVLDITEALLGSSFVDLFCMSLVSHFLFHRKATTCERWWVVLHVESCQFQKEPVALVAQKWRRGPLGRGFEGVDDSCVGPL